MKASCKVFQCVLALLLIFLSVPGKGIEMSLDLAINTALKNNPSIAQLQARYKALSELPSQAGSLPDPTLMLNAMNLPTNSFNIKQEPMTQIQIGIGQAFPFPGKLNLRKEVKIYQALAAAHSVDELKRQIISDVTESWWQIFFLDRAIDVINNNQELMRQLLDVARTKYEVGKGLQQDVLLAQLELSKLLDKEIELKSMRNHANIKLNVLLDCLPNSDNTLPKKINDSIRNIKNEESLYCISEQYHGKYLEKKQLQEAAQSNLKLAKKGYYPDFNLSVVYGERQGENPPPMNGKRSDFLSVMFSASMPIYARNKQSKEICQRAEELASSKYAVHDEINSVKSEIAMAVTDLNRAKEQYELFKTGIVPQAQQTVSSMLSGYQVNKVDFLNLIRSQITLLNYQLQYWKAFTEAQQSIARLKAAVGEEKVYVE